jgi:hypothetical protein
MKTLLTLVTLLLLPLSGPAADTVGTPHEDIPLSDGIRRANELCPGVPPLTEAEVVAAVKAIKWQHPDIKQDVYEAYMRVVNERVLPKGMSFRRFSGVLAGGEVFQVDFTDLCLERSPTAEEMQTLIATHKAPSWPTFAYRIRSRFVSVDQAK